MSSDGETPMPQNFTLRVNGEAHNVEVEPDTPLLYVLRGDLGLFGAKYGCGLEQCGACTVLVDGESAHSCTLSVAEAAGCDIATIEGLGEGLGEGMGGADDLHPLQRAFLDHQAAQCGYCTAGIIMEAKALLERNPRPSDREIRTALAHNLCRCGTHSRVIKAVRQAAGMSAS